MSDLQNALIMDGETRGPAPRWKKKLEASLNGSVNTTRSVLSVSYNTSFSGVQAPTKTPGKSSDAKTKKNTTTPTKTPGGGDRFIPNRAATNFELAHFLVISININTNLWIGYNIERTFCRSTKTRAISPMRIKSSSQRAATRIMSRHLLTKENGRS